MDIIECMEMVSGEKLLDYQKKFVRYVEEHPDCKIEIGRGSTRSYDFMTLYFTCKSILLKEDKLMGVRLSVTWNNEYFECPHKYYGYEKLDSSESYKYLHDILKVSEKEDPDMLQGLYDYWAGNAGPYTLSEDEFKLFVELYCKDLTIVFPGKEVGGVEKLKDISTKPGNKQIDWG